MTPKSLLFDEHILSVAELTPLANLTFVELIVLRKWLGLWSLFLRLL